MSEKTYKTRQRSELLEFLESRPGVHFTVNDAVGYFHGRGQGMGTTTVYRQLERLVEEGLVNKYTLEGSAACFEYIPNGSHLPAQTCFHCKCVKCGRLIHLHCDELEEIQQHLRAEHAFRMDPLRTVFYGVCESCAPPEDAGMETALSEDSE